MPVTKVLLDETVDTSITWTKMSENLPPNNSEQKKVEVFFFYLVWCKGSCSPSWPWTYSVAHGDPPASTSQEGFHQLIYVLANPYSRKQKTLSYCPVQSMDTSCVGQTVSAGTCSPVPSAQDKWKDPNNPHCEKSFSESLYLIPDHPALLVMLGAQRREERVRQLICRQHADPVFARTDPVTILGKQQNRQTLFS